MFRKNTGNPQGRGSFRSGQPQKGGQQPQAKHKQVSSNYRVDLMHHSWTGQQGQPSAYGQERPQYGRPQQNQQNHQQPHQPRPPKQQHPQPRPFPPRPQNQAKRGPQPRKGHGLLNVSIKEELLAAFIEKVRREGNQVGEVVARLIAAYNGQPADASAGSAEGQHDAPDLQAEPAPAVSPITETPEE